jgi:hypothetical protein
VSRGADSDHVRPLGETPEILTHKVMSHRYRVPDPQCSDSDPDPRICTSRLRSYYGSGSVSCSFFSVFQDAKKNYFFLRITILTVGTFISGLKDNCSFISHNTVEIKFIFKNFCWKDPDPYK